MQVILESCRLGLRCRIFCLFSPVAFGNCKNEPYCGVFAFVDPGRARKGSEGDACLIPRLASAEGHPGAERTSRARKRGADSPRAATERGSTSCGHRAREVMAIPAPADRGKRQELESPDSIV